MYIVVRRDLKPGAQIAQAIHAAQEFIFEHPEISRKWKQESGTLVCLSVENEQELFSLLKRAQEKIITSEFREPDLNNQLTAIVFEPGEQAKQFCIGLSLAGREFKC